MLEATELFPIRIGGPQITRTSLIAHVRNLIKRSIMGNSSITGAVSARIAKCWITSGTRVLAAPVKRTGLF